MEIIYDSAFRNDTQSVSTVSYTNSFQISYQTITHPNAYFEQFIQTTIQCFSSASIIARDHVKNEVSFLRMDRNL